MENNKIEKENKEEILENEQLTTDKVNIDTVEENHIETDISEVEVSKKENAAFNHVWWIPLIALLAVVYLAVNHFTSKGPLVTIRFQTAAGMEIKKTKLRYKDVVIGQVEKITLGKDYKDVAVSVRIDKDSEGLLREQSQFWVVRPRISVTKVSGLGTLLSGPYIAIDPDTDEEHEYQYEFNGLNSPPIITQDKPGLRLTMLTTKASAISPGTAVYYKGMQVGSVDRVYFSDDYLWVKADIFITSPHDKLIKQTTKFWSASGVSIDAGANGFDIEMESVETLLAGGIVFDTPIGLQKEVSVTNGTEYVLYDNRKQAFEQNYGKKHYYVTYFDSSIKGLEVGSPIMVQGINVGKVKDIQLLFDEKTGKTHLPILFEIYENRLGVINSVSTEQATNITKKLIENGLRTRLETASLLTGTKYIALIQDSGLKNKEKALNIDTVTGYPVLPSVPQSFDEITSGMNNLIAKVNKLPLNDIAKNINGLLSNTNQKISQLELKQTVDSVNRLLKDGQITTKEAKKTLDNLNRVVTKLSKSAEKTLSGFSPDAPLYYNLNNTLRELNETLSSLRAVTDTLERSPNALIFGEDK
ncbi:MAG: MCE family protein [Gammaproteobacteria bacterium]|nr:MCE family protein [Gammaproteobacteria bacterium]